MRDVVTPIIESVRRLERERRPVHTGTALLCAESRARSTESHADRAWVPHGPRSKL